MARNGMGKFMIIMMVLLIVIEVSVQAQRCEFSGCNFGCPYDQLTDMSTTASEAYEGTSKDSTQHHPFRKDSERNNQIQDEVTRKNQEISKLRTTIRSALHQLSKVVDFREEIPCVSDTYIERELRDEIVRIDEEIVLLKEALKLNKVPPTTDIDVSKPGDGTVKSKKRPAPDNEGTPARAPKKPKLDNRTPVPNNDVKSTADAYAKMFG